jgi:hypothetical protein
VSRPGAALWSISILIAILFVALFIFMAYDIVSKGVSPDAASKWIITQPFVALGRDFWFAVGAVLWAIGTIVFFLEITGRTFSGFKILGKSLGGTLSMYL